MSDPASSSLDVVSLEVGPFASNCHLLYPASSPHALVVDPGDDAPLIIDSLRNRGRPVAFYLLTHGHMDHVSALAEVAAVFPAPVGLHPRDASWAFTLRNTMPPYYAEAPRSVAIDRAWAEGQHWTDAGLSYEILETPGHSPGSVAFHFTDHAMLFAGDVLFQDSIGRADLPGGDASVLGRTLKRLLELPDETRVYPGHGPATTIGRERRRNPYLRDFSWCGGGC